VRLQGQSVKFRRDRRENEKNKNRKETYLGTKRGKREKGWGKSKKLNGEAMSRIEFEGRNNEKETEP